jgi:CO/xanthine dehydrogenase FAD-binding subunit
VRTALSRLPLHQPASLAEALRLLRDEGPLVPLAGCTDVYVALNFGTQPVGRYLDLSGLRALRGIRRGAGGTLVIGAMTTFAELGRNPLVRRQAPTLAEAARQVGGIQIQNRATLGGNIANASPAADGVPVLAAAEAYLLLASAAGERRVPVNGFFTGYRQTALRPDELILAIELPPPEGRPWFRKVGTRAANAISKVVLAGVRGARPRLAVGSVGPTVLRLPRTEAALAAGAGLDEATALLDAEITPIDDLRSTAAYRRRVTANLLRQFWKETAP